MRKTASLKTRVRSGKDSPDLDDWEPMETGESMQELSALIGLPEPDSDEFWRNILEAADRESESSLIDMDEM